MLLLNSICPLLYWLFHFIALNEFYFLLMMFSLQSWTWS